MRVSTRAKAVRVTENRCSACAMYDASITRGRETVSQGHDDHEAPEARPDLSVADQAVTEAWWDMRSRTLAALLSGASTWITADDGHGATSSMTPSAGT